VNGRRLHGGGTAVAFSHRPVVWFTSGTSEVSRSRAWNFQTCAGSTPTRDWPGTRAIVPDHGTDRNTGRGNGRPRGFTIANPPTIVAKTAAMWFQLVWIYNR
jgi:hypothetical protein